MKLGLFKLLNNDQTKNGYQYYVKFAICFFIQIYNYVEQFV